MASYPTANTDPEEEEEREEELIYALDGTEGEDLIFVLLSQQEAHAILDAKEGEQ